MYYFPYTFLQGVYHVYICISDRMAENIKEEKVSIKEEMSTVEDTCIVYVQEEMSTVEDTCPVYAQEEMSTVEDKCIVYVQEENVKEECRDIQGSINCIPYFIE